MIVGAWEEDWELRFTAANMEAKLDNLLFHHNPSPTPIQETSLNRIYYNSKDVRVKFVQV